MAAGKAKARRVQPSGPLLRIVMGISRESGFCVEVGDLKAEEARILDEKKSLWQLVWGVIDRPAATLRYVAEHPRWLWLAPALLVLIGLVVYSVVAAPLQAAQARAMPEVQSQLANVPAEQQQMVEFFMSPLFIGATTVVFGLLLLVIGWVLWAGLLYFVSMVMGGEAKYGQMFSVLAWAWLPYFWRYLTQAGWTFYSNQLITKPGLSFLVATGDMRKDSANFAYVILAQLDLFWLWHLFLIAVGVAVASRFSKGKAFFATVVYGAASLALTLIGPAIQGFISPSAGVGG